MRGIILGTVYFSLSVLIILICERRWRIPPWALGALMVGNVLLPLFIDFTPRNLIQSVILSTVILIEVVFAYQKLSFTSSNNGVNVAYLSLKRTAFIIVSTFFISYIAKWPAPVWGMKSWAAPLWLQVIVTFFVMDFFLYWYHRGQHSFDFWWRFHKIHHAPTEMTTLVAGRMHLVEWMVKQCLGPGLLIYFIGATTDAYIYGYVLPVLIFDSLAHANLDFPTKKWAWLNHIFMLPNTHAIHHTYDLDRKNYGVMLMVWDKLFGTYSVPGDKRPEVFGIANDDTFTLGVWAQHLRPFQSARLSKVRVNSQFDEAEA
jgi:sterol desaturase/sphingolipid hydroxylase (fatty acid hydroxylase superfamily)